MHWWSLSGRSVDPPALGNNLGLFKVIYICKRTVLSFFFTEENYEYTIQTSSYIWEQSRGWHRKGTKIEKSWGLI